MKNIDKLIYLAAIFGLVACNSNKKHKFIEVNKKVFSPFSVNEVGDNKYVISLNFNKKNISCESPCKLYKTHNFLRLTNSNVDTLYNRKGEVLLQLDNQDNNIELTNNFAKITSKDKTIVYSGYNSKKILEENNDTQIKISNQFLTSENKKIKIWNSYGQLIDEKSINGQKLNLHLSNSFVGYTLGFKELILYASNSHKLASYEYKNKRPMKIQMNNSFAYYSIGKEVGVLHAKNGQKLMNFAGRPTEAIYMNENVGGFYDISESASFWRSNGNHIVSLIKEPGLEISQINDVIEYKTDKNKRYKKIN